MISSQVVRVVVWETQPSLISDNLHLGFTCGPFLSHLLYQVQGGEKSESDVKKKKGSSPPRDTFISGALSLKVGVSSLSNVREAHVSDLACDYSGKILLKINIVSVDPWIQETEPEH